MPTCTTSDGVSLHYTDEGSGSPIVLIPGFAASVETWELQRGALTEAGHRVLALDRRGHGGSESTTWGLRMSRHGKDLHNFLATLDLSDVVLVGGSMGAGSIWAYCDLFGDGRARGIVTVDQTPRMLNGPGWEHGFFGLTAENIGTFFAGGVPHTGRGLKPEVTAERLTRLVERLGRPPEQADWRPMAPLLQDHAAQDWRDVITRLTVPSLFLAGHDSQVWPWSHATAAASLNDRAEALILDDCGHAMNIDQADQVGTAIARFAGALR
ncbi:alpha/beta fold hydrolase [Actinoplanes sp. N902-109]|uniref:alpha/beta fold hydrolase n=1 Tax=Actinoplanes sp. (strain N902-109) TaxID=649831 RepID=UPI00032938BA|nr:alpha/beta hydrolase [Actinoplanes sp. N902-109]AGL13689.1 alpha/beta hydrolase fold protein [Actinoplanes sp. N902-109]